MGCSGSSSAASGNATLWSELKQRLPLDKTPEQQKKRDILFAKFDENQKNSLTEAECLAGCKKHLELDKLSKNLPAINNRAYKTASGLRTREDATAGVDPAEFRLYLQYIRDYFELNVMFDEVDTSSDRIVTLAEFKSALPRIEKWGLKISDPEAEFKKVDKDGGGVNFDEFADWAIKHSLDAEKDAKASAVPVAQAQQPAAAAGGAAAATTAAQPAPAQNAAAQPAPTQQQQQAPAAAPAAQEKKKEEEKAAPVAAAAPKEEKPAPLPAPTAAAVVAAAPHEEKAAPAPAHAPEEKHAEKAPAPAPVAAPHHEEKPAPAPAPAQEVKAAPAPAPLSDAAAKRKALWTDIKTRLPRKKTPEQNAQRDEIFQKFDPNGNGYLSYAEIERGCKEVLKLDDFTDNLDPILIRAYNAARNARKGKGTAAADQDAFVERVEFRLLLVYIYDYFELWVAFDEIDSSDDLKVSLEEFKHALPKFEKWGVKITDPAAEFAAMDKNGGGSVTFPEFAEWAISKHLDADGEQNQA